MKCTLVILIDSIEVTSHEFDQDKITIGRVPESDLFLDEISVSRNHAEIIRKGPLFEIVDLESKNGIKQNGQQVANGILNNGDKLEIGNVSLEFRCDTLSAMEDDECATLVAEDPVTEEDQTVILGNETMIFQAPKLVVASGEDSGKEYFIDKGVLTIGRFKENDIIIDNTFVSRHHARILLHDETVTLKDLDSGNGTLVNDKKIHETILKSGDEIKIGEVTLKFLEHGEILPIEDEKKPSPLSIPEISKIPYPAILAASLVAIIVIGIFLFTGKEEEKTVQQQETGDLSKDLAMYTQGQADMAVSMLREIQQNPQTSEQPTQTDPQKAPGEYTPSKTTVIKEDNMPNVSSISNALALYTEGLADKSIAMLKEINIKSKDRKQSAQARTYISAIEKVKDSYHKGTLFFEEKLSEKAFAEWKRTLIFEKELPLVEKSWYSKKIAGAAADELYEKGLASFNKGDKETAVKNWKKAVEIVPNHKEALAGLAEMAGKL